VAEWGQPAYRGPRIVPSNTSGSRLKGFLVEAVALLRSDYLLVRFGTGDLSEWALDPVVDERDWS